MAAKEKVSKTEKERRRKISEAMTGNKNHEQGKSNWQSTCVRLHPRVWAAKDDDPVSFTDRVNQWARDFYDLEIEEIVSKP